jgi:protein-tyrosine phosphatase
MQTSVVNATPSESKSSSSAGYFGFVVDPNDPAHGHHSRKNWSPASSSIRSAAARSPLPVHLDNPPTPFQIQTEVLAQKLPRSITPPPGEKELIRGAIKGSHASGRDVDFSPDKQLTPIGHDYFSTIRTVSPDRMEDHGDEPWPPLSAPTSLRATPALLSPLSLKLAGHRAATLPNPLKDDHPSLITPLQLSELIPSCNTNSLLLLDVRTYKLFAASRIKMAVNLCIPTTLLKRPSFNVTKLSDTFANTQDKERFGQWKKMKYIVVYDADSKDLNDSSVLAALHTLKKFSREGWDGLAYILKGAVLLPTLLM